MPRGTFFCRLNYLEVQGNLGRGEQFSDGFFATNDRLTIENIVDEEYSQSMGNLEFRSARSSPLLVYKKIPELPLGAEAQKIIELLILLDSFEDTFWLHGDSCVGHELAFILNGPTIHSNLYRGFRSRADSTCGTLTLSAEKFREIARFYRRALHPDLEKQPARYHTKTNSTRYSRAFGHVGRAQSTTLFSEKITFYCSALEALLATQQAELSHQIAERVALISSVDPEQRMQNYRFLKECYSFRSKYIHGSPISDIGDGKMAEMSTKLDAAVRDAVEAVFNDEALAAALSDQTALDNYMLQKIFN
jgi:Apea-like HEPN